MELCGLSRKHHSLKSPYVINSQKFWSRSKTIRSRFSQAAHNWETCECPKQSFTSAIRVWKIYTKAVIPNPFVTADRWKLDNFAETRAYSRNSVSMRRIAQSHAQKASGVTTSLHFVISRPGTGSWLWGWDLFHKACCALVFDTLLDIPMSEKTMSETYSELLRCRMILLTLESDNSISKLGA